MSATIEAFGPVVARALDPEAITPDDPTSRRILDGALDAAAASGIKNLTLEDVARRAGVGRVTVYRRFGGRQELIESLAVREARRCLAVLDEATTPDQPISEQVAEGFVAGLRLIRQHPLISRLVTHEPDVVLESLTNQRAGIFPLVRAFVAARIAASEPERERSPEELEQIAEVFLRVTLSFALLRDSALPLGDENAAREAARRLIAPIVA